ncbi:Hint domain-containing protein [Acidocella sp. KAb 2-4]|uniref:Hint domain-containing protein n=1 Tax=Acidocella sp. KAb 2-4 TaxID=2885158 RepID=UPI002715490B|nr:Hint domain-containing protein [Acidocella sp. KAb 2-4]
MSGSTISTTITHAVTLGLGAYASPLTITNLGTIAPVKLGGPGVIVPSYAANTLISYGVIGAGQGSIGTTGTAGSATGGTAGQGSPGGNGGTGGVGGIGVSLAGAGTFINHGAVAGGAGGTGGTGGNAASGATNAGARAGNGGAGGVGGVGVALVAGGSLDNHGSIAGGAGGLGGAAGVGQAASPGAAGVGGYGVSLTNGAVVSNEGVISGGAGASAASGKGGQGGTAIYLSGATLINAGTVAGGAGGVGPVNGVAGSAVQFGAAAGLLIVDPGASFTGNIVARSGVQDVLELSGTSATALTGIGTQFQNFSEISFASGADWTIAGDSAGLAAGVTIAGFAQADAIDLTDFAATTETYVSGSGLIVSNASQSETIHLTGNFVTADFALLADGAGGTLIEDVNCFARGTRIATAAGEVPVEALKIGMNVRTLGGALRPVKWIGRRSYAAPFANHAKVLPVCIKAGAIAPGIPSRDLLVSPGHAICIGGGLIHASRLVNGVTITQLPRVEAISYYHVELDSHDVILAENCPAETFMGERFRGQFENAAEFRALYPGAMAAEEPCMALLSQGFRLQAILNRLARRAGLPKPRQAGPLRGFVDQAGPDILTGWAQDMAATDWAVCLDVFSGDQFVRRIIANMFREDLREAGIGSGNHAFCMSLPKGLEGPLSVRRTAGGGILPHSGAAEQAA